jgi:hypothetical protein
MEAETCFDRKIQNPIQILNMRIRGTKQKGGTDEEVEARVKFLIMNYLTYFNLDGTTAVSKNITIEYPVGTCNLKDSCKESKDCVSHRVFLKDFFWCVLPGVDN